MMDYTAAAIILFAVIVAIGLLTISRRVARIEKMLASIMEGGRFALPKINDGMRVMELTVMALQQAGKRIAGKIKAQRSAAHLKNMGDAEVVPDVLPWQMRRLAEDLSKQLVHKTADEVSLTDAVWIKGGRWKTLTNGTPAQFYAAMKRLEAARIVTKKDPTKTNSGRVFAMPYRSLNSKLQAVIRENSPRVDE